jgi:HAD superfamily hydrolase (TIGR01490 family)
MEAVVSDLEGTLTAGAMWRGFGEYLKRHRSALTYQLFFFSRVIFIPIAKIGLINERDFKSQWVIDLLKQFRGADADEVQRMVAFVVDTEMWPKRRSDVIAELEAHRVAGRRVIIATGVYQPIADEFARRIGVEAVSTLLEVDASGRLTGNVAGEISVSAEKVERLHAALNGDTILAAYGDTEPDIPMLSLAAEPVAVYPDAKLRAAALAKGWRILESGSQSA